MKQRCSDLQRPSNLHVHMLTLFPRVRGHTAAIVLLVCLVSIQSVWAQQGSPDTFAMTTSGCRIVAFTPAPDQLVSWSGNCVDNLVSGVGIMDSPSSGEHYEGEMALGKPNGYGTVTLTGGDTLEGNWKDGLPSGQVIFTRADGYKYAGGWSDGVPEGRGIGVWPNGREYKGEWTRGNPSGMGVMTYPSHAVFDGVYRDGKRNGHGRLSIPGRSAIEGTWIDNTLVGPAYWSDVNGNRYTGLTKLLERDGQGEFDWANGDKYIGAWKSNLPTVLVDWSSLTAKLLKDAGDEAVSFKMIV